MATMPTVAERVSVVEIQVANLDEKINEIKDDVRDLGTTLTHTIDVNNSEIKSQLKEMNETSCSQHNTLATKVDNSHTTLLGKIEELEKFKRKGLMIAMLLAAYVVGSVGSGTLNLQTIIKFVGL